MRDYGDAASAAQGQATGSKGRRGSPVQRRPEQTVAKGSADAAEPGGGFPGKSSARRIATSTTITAEITVRSVIAPRIAGRTGLICQLLPGQLIHPRSEAPMSVLGHQPRPSVSARRIASPRRLLSIGTSQPAQLRRATPCTVPATSPTSPISSSRAGRPRAR